MVQNRAEASYSYATVRYMVMLEVMFIFLLVHENHPGNHTMIWKVVYNIQHNVLPLSESQECLFKTTLKNVTVRGPSVFQQFQGVLPLDRGRWQSPTKGLPKKHLQRLLPVTSKHFIFISTPSTYFKHTYLCTRSWQTMASKLSV